MDLIETISKNDRYTLHSHTQFCDGHAPMEDFAARAVAMGFCAYGFTPHSPVPIESSCNMSRDDVPAYLAEVRRLQQAYPDVRFLAGMEVDYLGPQWGPASEYFKTLPLDFTIGSVHFIPSQDGDYVDIDGRYASFERKMAEHFRGDIRYVVETFFRQSEEMVERGGFDIIGHFDKIKHNAGLYRPGIEDEDWYGRLVDSLIDRIIDKRLIVEINTKAWAEHRQLFPAQRHWKRLLQTGLNIVVNSDAHYPDRINASRQPVLASLAYLKAKPHLR